MLSISVHTTAGAGTVDAVTVADALLAIAAADRVGALRIVAAAADAAPAARLPVALARYLRAEADGDVYSSPDAFERFIDGGSNRGLYDALHAHLRARYDALGPASLVDLGSGDGRVVRAVLGGSIERVDLVEPSEALLALAVEAVAASGVAAHGHAVTAAAFLATSDGRWDVAQSTFAIHTMPAADQAGVLGVLAERAGRVVLAEFDVSAFADRSPEHAAYAADRYERGLAEYDGDDAVAQGFLMPVLVGQFEPGAVRHTHEQSADAWVAELRAAGFATVTVHRLHPYWWADAIVLEATP